MDAASTLLGAAIRCLQRVEDLFMRRQLDMPELQWEFEECVIDFGRTVRDIDGASDIPAVRNLLHDEYKRAVDERMAEGGGPNRIEDRAGIGYGGLFDRVSIVPLDSLMPGWDMSFPSKREPEMTVAVMSWADDIEEVDSVPLSVLVDGLIRSVDAEPDTLNAAADQMQDFADRLRRQAER